MIGHEFLPHLTVMWISYTGQGTTIRLKNEEQSDLATSVRAVLRGGLEGPEDT
jgi:hypothetical protein